MGSAILPPAVSSTFFWMDFLKPVASAVGVSINLIRKPCSIFRNGDFSIWNYRALRVSDSSEKSRKVTLRERKRGERESNNESFQKLVHMTSPNVNDFGDSITTFPACKGKLVPSY